MPIHHLQKPNVSVTNPNLAFVEIPQGAHATITCSSHAGYYQKVFVHGNDFESAFVGSGEGLVMTIEGGSEEAINLVASENDTQKVHFEFLFRQPTSREYVPALSIKEPIVTSALMNLPNKDGSSTKYLNSTILIVSEDSVVSNDLDHNDSYLVVVTLTLLDG